MPHIDWLPFLGVVLLAYAIPGPDFAVIVKASTAGRRFGAAAAAGAQTGLCVHMLLAAVGLSVVLSRIPLALTVIQLAGAAYLIFLGVRAIMTARRASSDPEESRDVDGVFSWYARGFTTNVLNPKAILFFVSVLPQFIDVDAPLAGQTLLLGVVDVFVGFVPRAALILAAGALVERLRAPRARRRWDIASGATFIGIGAAVAVARV